MPPEPTDQASPSDALAHARALLDSDPLMAERQAREVLKYLPDDARAIALVGAARRRRGDLAAARDLLGAVVARRPDVERAGWEFGLTLAALGDPAALATLRGGARYLAATDWHEAAELLAAAGNLAAADIARAEHIRRITADETIRAAADALRAGQRRDAGIIIRHFLRRHPDNAEALWILAAASH